MIAGATDDHLVETALTAVAAFGSFLIAEHFGASGVLATVAAGMTMGNIGVLTPKERFGLSLTPHGRAFVLEFWEFAAFLANSLVFLLIGSALATVDFAREGFIALALVIALSLAGRAAAVYPVCLGFSRTRWAIRLNEQHLMWWGGLRGALALALALSLPYDLPMRDDILISAFAVVAFSVIVQGLTAPQPQLTRLFQPWRSISTRRSRIRSTSPTAAPARFPRRRQQAHPPPTIPIPRRALPSSTVRSSAWTWAR